MSRETDNKAIVGRWFEGFWANPWNPKIIDALAAEDMLLQYSLHAPRRGREDVRNFIMGFREAFPDLNFWGTPVALPVHRHIGNNRRPSFAPVIVALTATVYAFRPHVGKSDGSTT
jgi:hypothetical protein